MDIATRAYNHTFRIDPIIRTLMDTDFYKLLMQQVIYDIHPDTKVKFSLINRTSKVKLAEMISETELREQLDHARSLRFTKSEIIWLTGNTFYGKDQMFSPNFMNKLKEFKLPEYDLRIKDGQFLLDFEGNWLEASAWEIPALSIINELRSKQAIKAMSRFDIDVLYSRAKSKLWDKVERLRALQNKVGKESVLISDFGTRRRHSFLWQRWCIEALMEGIGSSFTGTSNVKHAMDLGLEAIGTNAHELPMVYAALANTDAELKNSRYDVLRNWSLAYDQRLRIILPDAYGTTSFLNDAPDYVADWTGIRPDSKDPIVGTYEYINWLKLKGRDPMEKVAILSDGMDIDTIEQSVIEFKDKLKSTPIGWGTNLTNDFSGCAADISHEPSFKPISLVCKVTEANGRPVVKLSDNLNKATGPQSEINRYINVFGTDGMVQKDVIV